MSTQTTIQNNHKTKVKFHVLHWDNIDSRLVNAHKLITRKMELRVKYHAVNMDHGKWMDSVIRNESLQENELLGFMDIDCVPLNLSELEEVLIPYVIHSEAYLGTAQVSNHYPPATNIYTAPAFILLHNKIVSRIKEENISMSANHAERCDVAELFDQKMGIARGVLYPKMVKQPKWKLADSGQYGIGTLYDNMIFHMFESRMASNIDLFEEITEMYLKRGDLREEDIMGQIEGDWYSGLDGTLIEDRARRGSR